MAENLSSASDAQSGTVQNGPVGEAPRDPSLEDIEPVAEDDGEPVDAPVDGRVTHVDKRYVDTKVHDDVDNPPVKRKRGRPKGYPHSGGRLRGGKDWTAPDARRVLLNKSRAIETMIAIAAGEPILCAPDNRLPTDVNAGRGVWRLPSFNQRLSAAQFILQKALPDMRQTELSGPGGEPLIQKAVDMSDPAERSRLARILVGLLASGRPAPASSPGDDANVVDGTSTRRPPLDPCDLLGRSNAHSPEAEPVTTGK